MFFTVLFTAKAFPISIPPSGPSLFSRRLKRYRQHAMCQTLVALTENRWSQRLYKAQGQSGDGILDVHNCPVHCQSLCNFNPSFFAKIVVFKAEKIQATHNVSDTRHLNRWSQRLYKAQGQSGDGILDVLNCLVHCQSLCNFNPSFWANIRFSM